MEIADIDPRLIDPHPRNAAIYGEPILPPEFIASIDKNGVLNRITVRRKPDGRYESISGHRRIAGAIAANRAKVPVEIREYKSEDEVLRHLVEFNMDREKTPRVRWAEMETLEITLTEAAKERQASALTGDESSLSPTRRQRESSGRTIAALAAYFHYSDKMVERLMVIYSDRYRGEFSEAVDSDPKVSHLLESAIEYWNEIRQKCDDGDLSVSRAADMIRTIKKQTLNPPKPKPERVPKAPKPKPAPKRQPPAFTFRRLNHGEVEKHSIRNEIPINGNRIRLVELTGDGGTTIPAVWIHPFVLPLPEDLIAAAIADG